MKIFVLILAGVAVALYSCFVAASNEDDKNGYN